MLKKFILSLKSSPARNDVFNPWWQRDIKNDLNAQAPLIRRRQLTCYLQERVGRAKYLLLAEAVGYQGGHFSGIPMTSERILLGGQKKKGILPEHVFSTAKPQRTSRVDLKPDGYSEPTATMVWGEIINSGRDPREFILWNAYPWHPYKLEKGLLSNRTPDQEEMTKGIDILKLLMKTCKVKNIIAIGAKSDCQLRELGIKAVKIRHPANGGAPEFRRKFPHCLRKLS